MRTKRIGVALVGGLAALAMTVGCSTNKVSAEDLKSELIKQNMAPDTANCIVDGLVAKGVPLENYSKETPSAEDSAKLSEVTQGCVSKTAGTVGVS